MNSDIHCTGFSSIKILWYLHKQFRINVHITIVSIFIWRSLINLQQKFHNTNYSWFGNLYLIKRVFLLCAIRKIPNFQKLFWQCMLCRQSSLVYPPTPPPPAPNRSGNHLRTCLIRPTIIDKAFRGRGGGGGAHMYIVGISIWEREKFNYSIWVGWVGRGSSVDKMINKCSVRAEVRIDSSYSIIVSNYGFVL